MKQAWTLADAANLTSADAIDIYEIYCTALGTRTRDDRSGEFHPSAIGYCGKRQVLGFMGVQGVETIDARSFDIFDVGHAVHHLIQGRLEHPGLHELMHRRGMTFEFVREVRFDPASDELFRELRLGGTTDGLTRIVTTASKQRAVIEIKSIGDDGFKKLNGPMESHLQQAHLYAYRFDCPVIYVWYFNKNNSDHVVYPVIFNWKIFDTAVQKLVALNGHIDAGTVPEREESYMECKNCEFRDMCKPAVLAGGGKDRDRKDAALQRAKPLGGQRA